MRDTQLETRTTEPLSRSVVETVAALKDTEPTELNPPLYTVIDSDALDKLFDSNRDGTAQIHAEVQFTYCGYSITVTPNGEVNAVPKEE